MISSDPYTHADHARACRIAAENRQVLVHAVQAKRGPIVYCAVIKNAYTVPGGPDCWTLQTTWPEKTRLTVPVRNVIACGGPTCSCVPTQDPDRTSEAQARAGSQVGDVLVTRHKRLTDEPKLGVIPHNR